MYLSNLLQAFYMWVLHSQGLPYVTPEPAAAWWSDVHPAGFWRRHL